jgi:hypothetical protein
MKKNEEKILWGENVPFIILVYLMLKTSADTQIGIMLDVVDDVFLYFVKEKE